MASSTGPTRARKTIIKDAGRIALVASSWAFVTGFAILAFSGRATWHKQAIVQKEVLGFAYAFFVAGTITGVVALASFGNRRWAIGLGLIDCLLLAASAPALHWLIFRLTAPNPF